MMSGSEKGMDSESGLMLGGEGFALVRELEGGGRSIVVESHWESKLPMGMDCGSDSKDKWREGMSRKRWIKSRSPMK